MRRAIVQRVAMGSGFPFIDIVIYAAVALFLIYKLGTVLGRRGDDQQHGADRFGVRDKRPQGSASDNVVSMPGSGKRTPELDFGSMDPLEAGIAQIKAADRSFREKEFLAGARQAFEMILDAFAVGNAKILKALLESSVYENFAAAIREREKAGHTLETTLVGIDDAEIVGAEMQGSNAIVTVKFVTGQVNATRDADGEVVDGDPNNVVQVTDIWTFRRNTRASDPNWVLIATGTPD